MTTPANSLAGGSAVGVASGRSGAISASGRSSAEAGASCARSRMSSRCRSSGSPAHSRQRSASRAATPLCSSAATNRSLIRRGSTAMGYTPGLSPIGVFGGETVSVFLRFVFPRQRGGQDCTCVGPVAKRGGTGNIESGGRLFHRETGKEPQPGDRRGRGIVGGQPLERLV